MSSYGNMASMSHKQNFLINSVISLYFGISQRWNLESGVSPKYAIDVPYVLRLEGPDN